MTTETPRVAPKAQQVAAVYQSLLCDIRRRDSRLDTDSPDGIDVPSIGAELRLPLLLWATGEKPTRTVPALVAHDRTFEASETPLLRALVGLDVLVTMLDEFIDRETAGGSYRLQVAINAAFASLFSFTNLPPSDAEAVVATTTDYLVQTARIPAVERAVQRELRAADTRERERELIRFAYATRAGDIAVFGRLPGIVHDTSPERLDRIVRDLITYRARYLVFDDIRDVGADRLNGDETPVGWLLATHDDPDTVRDILAAVIAQFEYEESHYRDTLRELEREPTDVRSMIAAGMDVLAEDAPPSESGTARKIGK